MIHRLNGPMRGVAEKEGRVVVGGVGGVERNLCQSTRAGKEISVNAQGIHPKPTMEVPKMRACVFGVRVTQPVVCPLLRLIYQCKCIATLLSPVVMWPYMYVSEE